jgi:hypothetical protein
MQNDLYLDMHQPIQEHSIPNLLCHIDFIIIAFSLSMRSILNLHQHYQDFDALKPL